MPRYYAVYPLLLVPAEAEEISTAEIKHAFKNPQVKSPDVPIRLFQKKSAAVVFANQCKKQNENHESFVTPIFEITIHELRSTAIVSQMKDGLQISLGTDANVRDFQGVIINDFYLPGYYSGDPSDEKKIYLPSLQSKAAWDGFALPPWWVILLYWTIIVPIVYALYCMYERSSAQEILKYIGDKSTENWEAQEVSFEEVVKKEGPESTVNYSQAVTRPQSSAPKPVDPQAEIMQKINEKKVAAKQLIESLDIGASCLDGLQQRVAENAAECSFEASLNRERKDCQNDPEKLAKLDAIAGVLSEIKSLALSSTMVKARKELDMTADKIVKEETEGQQERDEQTGGILSALGMGTYGSSGY